jgi:hypothetical protein
MSDDTRRVLDLLAQSKITVDEAGQLLAALGAPPPDAAGPKPEGADRPKPRFVRITMHKPANQWRGEKDVTIRVPIAIVRSGMRLGAIIPGFGGKQMEARLREQGLDIDLSKIDPAAIESMLNEVGDAMSIDLDSGKAQVRITCE